MVMMYIKAMRGGSCVCLSQNYITLRKKTISCMWVTKMSFLHLSVFYPRFPLYHQDYVWDVSNNCNWPKMDHLLAVNISQEELDDATKEREGASLGGGCIYGRQRAVWGLVVMMMIMVMVVEVMLMVMMLLKLTVVVWSCRYEATWSSWLPIKSHFGANLQTFTHFKLFKLELCQKSKSKWETRLWSGDNASTAFKQNAETSA